MDFIKRLKLGFSSKKSIIPIYSQQAGYIVQAAESLLEMMKTTENSEWTRLEKEVKLCEVQGDAMLTEFYEELYEKIFSRISKADLQTIAMNIDDFLDGINGAAKSILLYNPQKIDSQLVDLAQYIVYAADALKNMVSYLDDIKGNFSAVAIQCDRITEVEHAADDAYEEYIGYIFNNEKNAIELMKYKNIAESLEAATDAAKSISDHIRKVMLRFVSE